MPERDLATVGSLLSPRSGRSSLGGCYLVVADKGDYQHEYVGVYDTLAKARSRARTHFNDTGEMTDVFLLVAAEDER